MRHAFASFPAPWEISSAGVRAIPGEPVDAWVDKYLREGGVPLKPDWRSRQVSPSMIEAADLILTAEEPHRRAVVLASPHALRRTFLLLQFARLAQVLHDDAALNASTPRDGSGASLLRAIAKARTIAQPTIDDEPSSDNVGRAVLRVAFRSRRRVQPVAAQVDSLTDPAFKGARALTHCADRIEEAVIAIARAAAPTVPLVAPDAVEHVRPERG